MEEVAQLLSQLNIVLSEIRDDLNMLILIGTKIVDQSIDIFDPSLGDNKTFVDTHDNFITHNLMYTGDQSARLSGKNTILNPVLDFSTTMTHTMPNGHTRTYTQVTSDKGVV